MLRRPVQGNRRRNRGGLQCRKQRNGVDRLVQPRMMFLLYREDTPSRHYTGLIHRGRCLLGVEFRWLPEQDRAIGLLIFDWWIGVCADPK